MELIKNHISATLNEGVIASVLPVSNNSKSANNTVSKKSFENIIKLQPDEKIMLVQRQHFITLFTPFMFIFFILGFLIAGVFAVQYQTLFSIPLTLIVDVFLIVMCFLTTFGIFSYLYWYYQFYVITNKYIIYRHYFTLGGHHSEEVFLETSPEREIQRGASNIIYGLLDVENVVVSFQRPGLGEFVFIAPENPQEIEDTLEQTAYERHKK